MDAGSDYRITTPEALRQRMGHAGKVTPVKLLRELDDPAIDFIRRSPFLVLSTADARGHQEASPKGDDPGFVIVEDRKTLLIPDRKGNKLLFGLLNILANPQVGLLFIVPPNTETLRVNGTAELTVDPQLLERLAARGKPAEIVIRLTVQQCFFHCAKAFIRSRLWEHQSLARPDAALLRQISGGEDGRGCRGGARDRRGDRAGLPNEPLSAGPGEPARQIADIALDRPARLRRPCQRRTRRLVDEARGPHGGVPIVVGEMVEGGLGDRRSPRGRRLEGDGNVEGRAAHLAAAGGDDPCRRILFRLAHRAFMGMAGKIAQECRRARRDRAAPDAAPRSGRIS